MSGDVSSVAESRSHLFNRERIFVGDGLHRLPGGDRSDKRCDIDPGSSDARLAKPDVRVHRDAWEHFHGLLSIVPDSTTQEGRIPPRSRFPPVGLAISADARHPATSSRIRAAFLEPMPRT